MGIYTYMPLGYRVLKKIERIIREEMDGQGAQELFMPVVHPAELWMESGRWQVYGKELMRMQDRHGRDYLLAPTHEEVITSMLRQDVRSYKQLPQLVYQIQTKFRDERRPRFGVMRCREFVMKDCYSLIAMKKALASVMKRWRMLIIIFSALRTALSPGGCRQRCDRRQRQP